VDAALTVIALVHDDRQNDGAVPTQEKRRGCVLRYLPWLSPNPFSFCLFLPFSALRRIPATLKDEGRGSRCVLSETKEEARGFAQDTFIWVVCYLVPLFLPLFLFVSLPFSLFLRRGDMAFPVSGRLRWETPCLRHQSRITLSLFLSLFSLWLQPRYCNWNTAGV